MTVVLVDDHLLRDVLTGSRPADLDGLASGLATTGLWLFRLCSAYADPHRSGALSAPVAALSEVLQERFRASLVTLPDEIEVLPLHELAWPMAVLQQRHRSLGRALSSAMAEALAASIALGADLAVSERDVGPALQAAADAEGIGFHVLGEHGRRRRPR